MIDPLVLAAGVLLGVGLIGYLLAPHVLGRGKWRLTRPQLCLSLWFGCFGAGLVSVIAGVTLLVIAGAQAAQATAVDPASSAAHLAAWLGLAASGVVVSVVGTQIGSMVVTERALRADFARLIAQAERWRREISGLRVWILNDLGSTVVGLRGRRHQVLVSRGVIEATSPSELHAVLEHERAHLRGGHDLALRIAMLQLACLPGRLTSKAMAGSTALLIELAADRAAARRVGDQAMTSALRRLAQLNPQPLEAETLQLRAQLLAKH